MAAIMQPQEEKRFPADEASLNTCEIAITYFLITRVVVILNHNCTRASLAKFAQSMLNSFTFVLTARQVKAVDEVERLCKLEFNQWRGCCEAIRKWAFLCGQE